MPKQGPLVGQKNTPDNASNIPMSFIEAIPGSDESDSKSPGHNIIDGTDNVTQSDAAPGEVIRGQKQYFTSETSFITRVHRWIRRIVLQRLPETASDHYLTHLRALPTSLAEQWMPLTLGEKRAAAARLADVVCMALREVRDLDLEERFDREFLHAETGRYKEIGPRFARLMSEDAIDRMRQDPLKYKITFEGPSILETLGEDPAEWANSGSFCNALICGSGRPMLDLINPLLILYFGRSAQAIAFAASERLEQRKEERRANRANLV